MFLVDYLLIVMTISILLWAQMVSKLVISDSNELDCIFWFYIMCIGLMILEFIDHSSGAIIWNNFFSCSVDVDYYNILIFDNNILPKEINENTTRGIKKIIIKLFIYL